MGRLITMLFGLWVVVGWMALVALTGLVFIAWGLRTRQFDDGESPTFAMLEDREPQAWPGRVKRQEGGPHA
jgi:cbb3-type cytochrome oxidase maturation protein